MTRGRRWSPRSSPGWCTRWGRRHVPGRCGRGERQVLRRRSRATTGWLPWTWSPARLSTRSVAPRAARSADSLRPGASTTTARAASTSRIRRTTGCRSSRHPWNPVLRVGFSGKWTGPVHHRVRRRRGCREALRTARSARSSTPPTVRACRSSARPVHSSPCSLPDSTSPARCEVRPGTTDLFVINARAREIRVYNDAGGLKGRFGGEGSDPGQFKGDPRGLAFTPDGATLFVSDEGNNRIQAFDAATLEYRYSIAGFTDVRGLAVSGTTLVACDQWDHSLKLYDIDVCGPDVRPSTVRVAAAERRCEQSPRARRRRRGQAVHHRLVESAHRAQRHLRRRQLLVLRRARHEDRAREAELPVGHCRAARHRAGCSWPTARATRSRCSQGPGSR